MNEDIKELLEVFKEYASGGMSGLYPSEKTMKDFVNYIEDLQNQNTELKEENEKYKGVIDKLKECIEKNKNNIDDSGTYVETYTGWKSIPEILEELLDILKEVE